jgi:hypothetical protein
VNRTVLTNKPFSKKNESIATYEKKKKKKKKKALKVHFHVGRFESSQPTWKGTFKT